MKVIYKITYPKTPQFSGARDAARKNSAVVSRVRCNCL
jgi:hypothetical protein